MARLASGRLEVRASIEEATTGLGASGGRSRLEHTIDYVLSMVSGTADGELDRVYSDDPTLTTTPSPVDLVGALPSELSGATVAFAELTGIIVQNLGTVGNVLIGGGSNPIPLFSDATDKIPVLPGGIFVWTAPAGLPLTAATADILTLAASAGTVAVKVLLFGRAT